MSNEFAKYCHHSGHGIEEDKDGRLLQVPEQETVDVRIITCARRRATARRCRRRAAACRGAAVREKPLHAGELLNAGKPLDTEASMHANDEELLHANDVEYPAAVREAAYLCVPKPHAWRRKDRCTDSGRHNGD